MKAIDLVKSLSLSSITSEDFKVVTLYKGQKPDAFLADNFIDDRISLTTTNGTRTLTLDSLEPLTILESQDYLAIYNNMPLVTPDGKSVFVPDYIYEVKGIGKVSLYSFN